MARRTTSRGWWLTLLAGVVVLGTGVAVLVSARTLPPAFTAHASGPSGSSSVPMTAAGASTAPVPPPAVVPAGPFRPASLTLAAFGVTAPVDPVFTAGGVLDPPDDPARVGWWGAGQWAGASTGSTVVVGHVDGPRGPGALYRLVHARAGDQIIVAGSNGRSMTYTVTSLAYHVKGSALPSSLFAADGAPRLVVISCGGTFDRANDEYADNVVVEASPV